MPASVRMTKPSTVPSQVMRDARSMLPAPMFWPTSVETAIDRPIAGIVTTCRIVEPTP